MKNCINRGSYAKQFIKPRIRRKVKFIFNTESFCSAFSFTVLAALAENILTLGFNIVPSSYILRVLIRNSLCVLFYDIHNELDSLVYNFDDDDDDGATLCNTDGII